MRISIDTCDKGHDAYERAVAAEDSVRIFFNGKQIDAARILTADEEAGFIRQFRLNKHGELFLDGAEAATETLHGKVRIVLEPKRASH